MNTSYLQNVILPKAGTSHTFPEQIHLVLTSICTTMHGEGYCPLLPLMLVGIWLC